MDKTVIDAMARWPNVPDVYGWLSLNQQGKWRLHPQGDALQPAASATPDAAPRSDAGSTPPRTDASADAAPSKAEADSLAPGEPITSETILQFIGRNYAADDQGRWYFQNGPQRVYVRLDAAPFIFHTASTAASQALNLRAHTGEDAGEVKGWLLADDGRLYAQTALGPGLIEGRDLETVLASLRLPDGRPLLDVLADASAQDGGYLVTHASATDDTHQQAQPDANDSRKKPAQTSKDNSAGQPLHAVTAGAPAGQARPAHIPFDFCPAEEVPNRLGFVRLPAQKPA